MSPPPPHAPWEQQAWRAAGPCGLGSPLRRGARARSGPWLGTCVSTHCLSRWRGHLSLVSKGRAPPGTHTSSGPLAGGAGRSWGAGRAEGRARADGPAGKSSPTGRRFWPPTASPRELSGPVALGPGLSAQARKVGRLSGLLFRPPDCQWPPCAECPGEGRARLLGSHQGYGVCFLGGFPCGSRVPSQGACVVFDKTVSGFAVHRENPGDGLTKHQQRERPAVKSGVAGPGWGRWQSPHSTARDPGRAQAPPAGTVGDTGPVPPPPQGLP